MTILFPTLAIAEPIFRKGLTNETFLSEFRKALKEYCDHLPEDLINKNGKTAVNGHRRISSYYFGSDAKITVNGLMELGVSQIRLDSKALNAQGILKIAMAVILRTIGIEERLAPSADGSDWDDAMRDGKPVWSTETEKYSLRYSGVGADRTVDITAK